MSWMFVTESLSKTVADRRKRLVEKMGFKAKIEQRKAPFSGKKIYVVLQGDPR
jgi:hypothetical protein